jgi:hypothetical protein
MSITALHGKAIVQIIKGCDNGADGSINCEQIQGGFDLLAVVLVFGAVYEGLGGRKCFHETIT